MYCALVPCLEPIPLPYLLEAHDRLTTLLHSQHGVIRAFHLPIYFHQKDAVITEGLHRNLVERAAATVSERLSSELAYPHDRRVRRLFNHTGATSFHQPDVFFYALEEFPIVDYDDLENQ